jgi:DNA-binding transcriptional ArsR family regulator
MSRSRSNAAVKVAESAPVFAALGDTTRLRLVARLSADGPLSIARLSEGAGVTRQAVTKHLEVLGEAGLVRHSRRGRERIWELEPKRLEIAQRYLSQIAGEWDAAIERLKAFVEERE